MHLIKQRKQLKRKGLLSLSILALTVYTSTVACSTKLSQFSVGKHPTINSSLANPTDEIPVAANDITSVSETSASMPKSDGNKTLSTVSLLCNEEKNVEAINISVTCSPDGDRDGAPDSDDALIEFKNQTDSPVFVTFPKRLVRDPMVSLTQSNSGDILPHHIYIQVSSNINGITTALIPSKGVLPLSKTVRSSDDSFTFDFAQSSQSFDLPTGESEFLSFNCTSQEGYVDEEIWGVSIRMICDNRRPKRLIISSDIKSNNEQRIAIVRPNYPGLEITHIIPVTAFTGQENMALFENDGQNYEVEIRAMNWE